MPVRGGGVVLLLLCSFMTCSLSDAAAAATSRPPNVLLIMVDDLGMGDVGAFGNDTIRTPHIDRLAREGVRFDHSIAAASVCTPSRAAFLTGRYPVRMGMVPTNIVRVNMFVSSTSGLPADEITIGELAKQKGYKTGFIGKWHLGVHCSNEKDFCHHPNKQGFDYYYGLALTNLKDFGVDKETVLNSRHKGMENKLATYAVAGILGVLYLFKSKIMGRYWATLTIVFLAGPVLTVLLISKNLAVLNGVVMKNTEVVEQPIHLEGSAQRLAAEGVNFIEQRKENNEPFLLVMSWYQVHTAMHASPKFQGQSAHGLYGDNVEEMDACVGRLLDALDTQGLANDTFVYLTSDNGGHVEEVGKHGNREGGFNGIYRGGKAQGGMDGGIRVPTVARWSGRIAPSSVMSTPVSLMDVFPTVAGMLNVPLPKDRTIDGTNLLPHLTGIRGHREVGGWEVPHKFLVHYCGENIHAARYTPDADSGNVWKVHFATPNWEEGNEGCGFICDCYGSAITWHDPPLLYNIGKDPSEKELLKVESYPEVMSLITEAVAVHRATVQPVENQYSILNMLPRPWLQPCCNFPYCKCTENITVGLDN